MRFMMMMNTPRGSGDYNVNKWDPKDLDAHIQFMHEFNRRLQQNGERVSAEGLAPPGAAKLVRASRSGGAPETDGVFPEAKEFLAGFWIIDVESEARALELAAEASVAPGPGGKPMYLAIEVRQVLQAPPSSDG